MIKQLEPKNINALYPIYGSEIGYIWPIKENVFLKLIQAGGVEGSFVAVKNDKVIGFIVTKLDKKGEIMILIVKKEWQRQGIGKSLVEKALNYFKSKDIMEIQLGAGANPYLWPGVPDNLPNAVTFFEKLGWRYNEESVDMVRDLGEFTTPGEIYERINETGVRLDIADRPKKKGIIEFEKMNFPQWVKYFESALNGESGEDVLLATDRNNEILGTALVGKKLVIWNELLGDSVGTIGALGVKEAARGQGIGLAMAAKATEMLKTAGMRKSYLGWTWLVDWYGKLGYKVWRKYQMAIFKL